MDAETRFRVLALVLAACGTAAVSACEQKQERTALPDWTEGYGDPVLDPGTLVAPTALQFGTYEDIEPEGVFAVVGARFLTHPYRLRELGSEDTLCQVTPGVANGRAHAMDCVLEMDELDISAQGLALDVVAPIDACDYIVNTLSMYLNYGIGESPAEVSFTVQADGTFTDQVNAKDGAPVCPFDFGHQSPELPDCCEGEYTQTVTYAATGKVDKSQGYWQGSKCDCYDGTAFLELDPPLTAKRCPTSKVFYPSEATPLHADNFVAEVRTTYPGSIYRGTFPLANYYDPADHDDGPPAAFTAPLSRELNVFQCLDHADEILAVITLVVRDWNEAAELEKDGDPETQGEEEDWPGAPIDDRADFAIQTPGSEALPMAAPKRMLDEPPRWTEEPRL